MPSWSQVVTDEIAGLRGARQGQVVPPGVRIADDVRHVRVVLAAEQCRAAGLRVAPRHEHGAPRTDDPVPVGEEHAIRVRRILRDADLRLSVRERLGTQRLRLGLQARFPALQIRRRQRLRSVEVRAQQIAVGLVAPLERVAEPELGAVDRLCRLRAEDAVRGAGEERSVGVRHQRVLSSRHVVAGHVRRCQMKDARSVRRVGRRSWHMPRMTIHTVASRMQGRLRSLWRRGDDVVLARRVARGAPRTSVRRHGGGRRDRRRRDRLLVCAHARGARRARPPPRSARDRGWRERAERRLRAARSDGALRRGAPRSR